MRYKTKRKNSRNRLLAISSFSVVALAGVIAGLYGLSNASAYDSDECTNELNNNSGISACATVSLDGATSIEAYDGGNTVSFLIDNQNVDLRFDDNDNGYGKLNFLTDSKKVVMTDDPVYYGFHFDYAGNFNENYYAYLTYPNGDFYSDIYCYYDSYYESSECSMSYQSDDIPDGAHFIIIKSENIKVNLAGNAESFGTSSGVPYAYWYLDNSSVDISSSEEGDSDDNGAYLFFPNSDFMVSGLRFNLSNGNDTCPTDYRFIMKDENDNSSQPWKTTLACTKPDEYYSPSLAIALGDNETLPRSNSFGVYLVQSAKPTITISGGDGSNSFYGAHISIDGIPVEYENQSCELNPESADCAGSTQQTIEYDKNVSPDGTTTINFSTLFTNKVTNIVINGTSYDIPFDYSDREEWLNHYDHQLISFDIAVPAADSYNITYNVEDATSDVQIGNFLWTNEDSHKDDDEYIGHATLELVAIQCHMTDNHANDILITEFNEASHENCLYEFESNNTEGSLVVPSDSIVTMKILTEYGYQIKSFGMNGDLVSVDPSKPSEFTFSVNKGNFHIGAEVEATDNEVNSDSEAIKSGSVELANGVIDAGTAMLTVGDADLSEAEQQAFQNEAGDYKVTSYLSIDLDQIFYDGHGNFWKGRELKDLNSEATVTLELDEGVDGNSAIIVHHKHDGSYEVIPTVYNAETHTITFKTSSFSDFAIASGNVATIVNANTLDNIKTYGIVFVACCSAFALAAAAKKAIRK